MIKSVFFLLFASFGIVMGGRRPTPSNVTPKKEWEYPVGWGLDMPISCAIGSNECHRQVEQDHEAVQEVVKRPSSSTPTQTSNRDPSMNVETAAAAATTSTSYAPNRPILKSRRRRNDGNTPEVNTASSSSSSISNRRMEENNPFLQGVHQYRI